SRAKAALSARVEIRRFALNARGRSPRAPVVLGGCSLPCGASRLRVLASHQVACAEAALSLRLLWGVTPKGSDRRLYSDAAAWRTVKATNQSSFVSLSIVSRIS